MGKWKLVVWYRHDAPDWVRTAGFVGGRTLIGCLAALGFVWLIGL